jgi:hypothetical protein
MELYPGPINTAVVELNERLDNDQSVHPGAIVAGLGEVGELTPGKLTSTLAYALTMYGADCVGRVRRRQQRDGVRAADNHLRAGYGDPDRFRRRRRVARRQRAGAAYRGLQANQRCKVPRIDGVGGERR